MKSVQQAGANKRVTACAAAWAAALVRPAAYAVLLCGAASVGAEPVIQPAMAPVDISKLLQNPYAASAPVESQGFGRRLELSLPFKSNFGVGQAAPGEADWQAAAAQVLVAPSADGKPARPQTEPGSSGPGAARTRPDASAAGQPTRDAMHAGDQLLINDALRELRDSSELRDFKDFWRDARAELSQFRGGLLFEEPSEEEMERRRSSRQRSELSSSGGFGQGGGGADPGARPRSDAEIRRDSILVSVMLKQLVDELTPWVIGLVLTLALGRGAWGYWRVQKQVQRRSKSSARPADRRSASQL